MKNKTHAEFLKDFSNKNDLNVEFLGVYQNTRTPIKTRHKSCGHIFYPIPRNLLKGSGCPMCCRASFGKHKTISADQFAKTFHDKKGEEYSLLTPYKSSFVKVGIRHNECGREFTSLPGNLINKNSRCPYCYGAIKKTTADFKRFVLSETGTDYEVLSEYKTNRIKVKMKHAICNHIYEVTPYKFSSGQRCPNCNASHGEIIIRDFLVSRGMKFKREVSLDGCVYKKSLKFDFIIFNSEGSPSTAIEFDGEQHFRKNDFFGGKPAFEETKKRDHLKNEFCLNNRIRLIRIPYYLQNEIPTILSRLL